MQNNERQNQPGGLNLADIYYTIFRHKWKIIGLSAAGLVAAVIVYVAMPTTYGSEAKLLIRYVVDSRMPSGMGTDPQIKTPDPGGVNIINSEVEIIRSLDLAKEVVDAIGADKILGTTGKETNKFKAATALQKGLIVEVPPRSDVLRIVFQSPNRDIVQPVLTQLIDAYMRKHVEIHRGIGAFDDVLTQQTDALRSQLAQTEEDLRRAQTNAGVMSIEESKKAYTEEISKTREQIFNSQAELAERQAAFDERKKLLPSAPTVSTNQPEVELPAGTVDNYRTIAARLNSFRAKEQELLSQYTDENSLVRGIREQIAVAEKAQHDLESKFPQLTKIQLPTSSKSGAPVVDLSDEATQITALQAKLKVLSSQLERLVADAKSVNALEPTITDLQRKRDLEETKYRHFSTSLEQARFDEALGASKMSNISVAQAPTPALRESRQMQKVLGMLVGGGVALGFGLAFLLELVIDPTVRRPMEVQTRLRLPLFLTIPNKPHKNRAALPAPGGNGTEGAHAETGAPENGNGSEVTKFQANGLGSYYEALRDRLVSYFEINNLVHKPKLIAVTGCSKGSGVTTIATGLAASLSETGDGNVLLVDMTTGQGAAHPFFKGKPGCGLADALTNETRDSAMVQENLYAVTESATNSPLPRALPRRFHNLVPKLKASDYDYIIFDMPPVNQISPTARVAGFMDMVLMVIESEKTDREAAKKAVALLAESKANVRAVLNKTERYVPERLLPED